MACDGFEPLPPADGSPGDCFSQFFERVFYFVVRYTKKETNGEMAEGTEEARELSAGNYGRDEWWLLLNPIEGGTSS